MAILWVRETPEDVSAATLGWTGTQIYNFFGSLIRDDAHATYSHTLPYTDWFVENLNAAIQIIHSYCPMRKELVYCTTTTSVGVYTLPDYALSLPDWVEYNGGTLKLSKLKTFREDLVDTYDEQDSYGDGTPVRWIEEGKRRIRLVPRPDSAKTLRVRLFTLPPAITTAGIASLVDLPAHFKTAPAYWIGAQAMAREGKVELSKHYQETFWILLKKMVEDNTDAPDTLDIQNPMYEYMTPDFTDESD